MYKQYTLLFEVYVMIARYTSAAGLGAIAALSLLLLMQALILVQPGASGEPRQRAKVDIVRVKKSEELRTRDFYRPDESIKKAETLPPRVADDSADGWAVAVKMPPPPAPSGSHRLTAISMSDGPLVAIVRVQPVYPTSAEVRGLEGWVVVQFDVLPDGGVADAFVVESSNRVFEKAALSAALRFRFKPQVVKGEPVATRGIQNLFRFEMPDR
jgi:protein TonB